jgi:hypothetical protein
MISGYLDKNCVILVVTHIRATTTTTPKRWTAYNMVNDNFGQNVLRTKQVLKRLQERRI